MGAALGVLPCDSAVLLAPVGVVLDSSVAGVAGSVVLVTGPSSAVVALEAALGGSISRSCGVVPAVVPKGPRPYHTKAATPPSTSKSAPTVTTRNGRTPE